MQYNVTMIRFWSIFVFIGLIVHANAKEIDDLLEHYRIDSDLSQQTIDESQGYLTLFTRDDIERMQARTLKDLLKSVRFYRYDENLFGQPDMLHADPVVYMSDPIRVYLNDHEIYSGSVGSGLFIYGEIDLGFVDHVEIYNGASSIEVNTEPATMIVKLFTRDPERENGYRLEGTVASRGSNMQNAAGSFLYDDFSLFAYVNRTEKFRTRYAHDGSTLSRDKRAEHLFVGVQSDRHRLDLEFLRNRADPFLGASMFATPLPGEYEQQMARAALTSYFINKTLELDLSYWHGNYETNLYSLGTLWSVNPEDWLLREDHLQTESFDDVVSAKLVKSFRFEKHQLKTGLIWRHKQIRQTRSDRNGVSVLPEKTDYRADIYSAFIQERYQPQDVHLLTGAAKVNRYDNRLGAEDFQKTTWQGRIGYIFNNGRFRFKTFAEHAEFLMEQYTLSTNVSNPDTVIRNQTLSMEIGYGRNGHDFAFIGAYGDLSSNRINEEIAGFDQESISLDVEYRYAFDAFNTLQTQYFFVRMNDKGYDPTEGAGGLLRVINTHGQWDFFNEAVYRKLDGHLQAGVDFSTGVRYRITPDAVLSVKGTNLFGTAAKSRYFYIDASNLLDPKVAELYIPAVDREIAVGVEWRF